MSAVVRWNDVPPEYRAAFEPMLMTMIDLLPAWCYEVVVDYDRSEEPKPVSITPEKEYRRAFLWVGPGWIDRNNERRMESILHEIIHANLEPLQNLSADLLAALQEKIPDAHPFMKEQRRYAIEETTCDLAHLILRLQASGP